MLCAQKKMIWQCFAYPDVSEQTTSSHSCGCVLPHLQVEKTYFENGGILHYVLRQLLAKEGQ